MAEPHVVEFVLGETEADGSLIYKGEDFVHVAGHSHFFLKAACGGFCQRLALSGMATAGVGPQAGGVVLRQGSLLEQQLAFSVED